MKIYLLAGLSFLSTLLFAQTSKEKQAIQSLCGCYEVEFKYAETFSTDTAYKIKPVYRAKGLEWVVAEESSDKKYVLQHLLIIDDTTIIKHWREDWEFEKNEWLQFNHDASWKKTTATKDAVKGQWTQTVWEVDDAPRYQGSANWVNTGTQYQWENVADAPLPRREYTKRSDYNVLERGNRIILTDTGWVHEQDNRKVVRRDGSQDVLKVEEKGYNIYHKTDNPQCEKAKLWWEKNQAFWSIVRKKWDELLKDKKSVQIITKVKGKYLYEDLADIQDLNLTGEALSKKIEEAIKRHIAG